MADRVFDPRCLRLVALLRQPDAARRDEAMRRFLDEWPPERVYLDILLPSVFFLGEEFVAGRLPRAAADGQIAEVYRLMALARQKLRRMPRLGKTIYATYMPGDISGVGFLAILDWLDRDGWDVVAPQPTPPEAELIAAIAGARPAVLAISCALPRYIVPARRVIRALRSAGFAAPVWIGGTSLNVVPGLFERSGADHTARDIAAFTRALAEQFGYQTATPADLRSPEGRT